MRLNELIAANPTAAATARYMSAVREYNHAGGNPDGPSDQVVAEAQTAHDALYTMLDRTAEDLDGVLKVYDEADNSSCVTVWRNPAGYARVGTGRFGVPTELVDLTPSQARTVASQLLAIADAAEED